MVFHNFGLLWIINNNKHLKFEVNLQGSYCMDKGPCYNTTIFSKLYCQILKDYLKTGRKDRYEFMCAVDVYDNDHVPMPNDESNGGEKKYQVNYTNKHLSHLVIQ